MSALVQPQPLQVTAVKVMVSESGFQWISHLMAGNVIWSREQVLNEIDYHHRYWIYTYVNAHPAKVIAVREVDGSRYLRTEADRYQENNLLSLPRF